MQERSHIFPLRRWLVSILVWYILFVAAYLILRFVFQSTWDFIAFLNNLAPYLFAGVVAGLLIAFLLRARRLSGMYLLVALIGLLWVGIRLVPSSIVTLAPAGDGLTIDLISYNSFPDNDDLSEVAAWVTSETAELVLLQDLPAERDALAVLDDLYPYTVIREGRTGAAIYSQYEILDSEEIDLVETNAQRVLLDIEGREVVLYNVHLWMPLNDRETDWTAMRYEETKRNAEVDVLLEALRNETLPLIVAGDFNLTEWSPIYPELDALLHDAYRVASWGIGATWPAGASESFGAIYPLLFRLDYVFYSEPFVATSAVTAPAMGSDHLPLQVELSFP